MLRVRAAWASPRACWPPPADATGWRPSWPPSWRPWRRGSACRTASTSSPGRPGRRPLGHVWPPGPRADRLAAWPDDARWTHCPGGTSRPCTPPSTMPRSRRPRPPSPTPSRRWPALYDDRGVRGGDRRCPARGRRRPAATFDEVLAATNDVLDRFARLEAFAYGHVSTDSGDEAAQALLSRLTIRRGPHHRAAHAVRRLGGRPRPRRPDRRQPGGRRPRLAAAQGGPPRRPPDVRARGVAGRRAGHHRRRRRGAACTTTSARA